MIPPQSREIDPSDPNTDVFKTLDTADGIVGHMTQSHNGDPIIFS